ncbi:MAG: GbsR/MarR family transcriptional regulator [Anaerolineae bacterium]
MNEQLTEARQNFIQGLSRISHFWGFPKAMGGIYGAIYLSPQPVSLDELVTLAGVSKGAVSANARTLERLGMVHKKIRLGDRKDYYTAETDFWKVVRGVLREREKSEFDQALRTVSESLELVEQSQPDDMAAFYQERMLAMKSFFDSLDNLVATLITLDELRFNAMAKLFGRMNQKDEG